MRENSASAGNQQGTPRRKRWDTSETTRRAPSIAEIRAYFLGAIHDGTYNRLHKTFRISQKGTAWLRHLQYLLRHIGHRAWFYQEGKSRNVYILETTAPFLTLRFDPLTFGSTEEKIAYVRGYFDAEGGIPHSSKARFYIQLCQKNRREMVRVRTILQTIGIRCGTTHNPSRNVDPRYWRVFVQTSSHQAFLRLVGSWHPRKQRILRRRMMI